MKKRLLITSIVMMLVVAVALSTATYAWFTSNARVEATSVTMTAAVNDAAAIGIAWVGSNAGKENLVALAGDALYPMVPGTLVKAANEDLEAQEPIVASTSTTMGYATSTIYTNDNGATYKFNAAGSSTGIAPYVWNDGGNPNAEPAVAAVEKFYIRNLSPTTAIDVTISVNIADYAADDTLVALTATATLEAGKAYYKKNGANDYTLLVAGAEIGDTVDYVAGTSTPTTLGYTVYALKADVSELVRVAVFTSDTVNGTYKLLDVFSEAGGTNVSSGAIAANTDITSVANKQASIAENTPTPLKANLAGNTDVYVIVQVWLDGNGLVDVLGGGQANVALTFDAAKHA